MAEFSQDLVSAMVDLAQMNRVEAPWMIEFMAFLWAHSGLWWFW